jgi:hypothetical protein
VAPPGVFPRRTKPNVAADPTEESG